MGAKTKKIRIAFYKGPTSWKTWIVSKFTGSLYTHVEIVMPSEDVIGISPEGISRVRMLQKPILEDDEWDFIDVKVTDQQIERIVSFFTNTHGCGYDWFGMLISYITRYHVKHERKFYCSQWVSIALTISDIYSFNYIKMSPGKLYDILATKVNNNIIKGSVEDS